MRAPFIRRISLVEQTVECLREGIRSERWKGHLPGSIKLAAELGVSRRTTRAAVATLVAEGVLAEGGSQGAYAIALPEMNMAAGPRRLRIGLLLQNPLEDEPREVHLRFLRLADRLKSAGHFCEFVRVPPSKNPDKTGHLSKVVKTSAADAWILNRPSLQTVQWFIASKIPAMALGGRSAGLAVASTGIDAEQVLRQIVRRLVGLGHRRIVFLVHPTMLAPTEGPLVRVFREELAAAGVKPGEFNVPVWEETPAGLAGLFDSLYRYTPPTALICLPVGATFGTINHILRHGLRISEDVSLVSLRTDPCLDWILPGVTTAHTRMDETVFFRRTLGWVKSVSTGKPDTRRQLCPAEFIEGDTVGPAKQR